MQTFLLAVCLLTGTGQSKSEAAVLGDWIAIATNGVSVKEMLRLTPDHRFKVTAIYGVGVEKKYRGKRESGAGSWRLGTIDLPDEKGVERPQETIFLTYDKQPGYQLRFVFYRQVPVMTDILTTTFARPGDEARVYKLLYKKKYRPPWKS